MHVCIYNLGLSKTSCRPLAIMEEESGYDSDYGYTVFTHVPTVQMLAAVSYEEYCTRTKHKKSEGKEKERGKMKGKTTINCHARDLRSLETPAAFMAIIRAVSDPDGRKVYYLESGRQPKPPVVSK